MPRILRPTDASEAMWVGENAAHVLIGLGQDPDTAITSKYARATAHGDYTVVDVTDPVPGRSETDAQVTLRIGTRVHVAGIDLPRMTVQFLSDSLLVGEIERHEVPDDPTVTDYVVDLTGVTDWDTLQIAIVDEGAPTAGLLGVFGMELYIPDDIPSDSGSFALSGGDATLVYGRAVVANSGSFALTGNAAGLRAARVLSAGSGSFSLSGGDAGLLYGRLFSVDSGAFLLAGSDASFVYGRAILAETGEFVLVGYEIETPDAARFSAMLAVADAIVSGLNAHTFTKDFTAERIFTAEIKLKDFSELKVLVRGVSETPRPVSRGQTIKDVVVEVFVAIRFPSGASRTVPTNSDIDPYVEFLEEIAAHFNRARLTDIPEAIVMEATSLPSYDEGQLRELHQYTGVVRMEVADWR